jgi:hypothetical protein
MNILNLSDQNILEASVLNVKGLFMVTKEMVHVFGLDETRQDLSIQGIFSLV